MKLASILSIGLLVSSTAVFAGKPVSFIKGNNSIFKGSSSFLVEMDLSTTAIDALDTEQAFVEYNMGKEKDPTKWENGWKQDKAGFLNAWVNQMARSLKKTQLKVSSDDPDSKYKMILRPNKIKTGTPVRYSAVEMKIHVYDMATQEEVAIIHVPEIRGTQWSIYTPTMGMTVNMAIIQSAGFLAKYINKSLK